MAENGDPLLLQAFRHQVGGNFLIMEIDRDWICKPMLSRERLFYETAPEPIKQFIPQYRGIYIYIYIYYIYIYTRYNMMKQINSYVKQSLTHNAFYNRPSYIYTYFLSIQVL